MTLPEGATVGTRLRFLRKRLGVTLERFSQITGLSRNAIGRVERDQARYIEPRILGRLLPHLSQRFKEAFPEGDPYEFLIPSKTVGGWIRNQRLRRGMSQKDLARALRVHQFTVLRYERNSTQPDPNIQRRLRSVLGTGFEPLLNRATISTGEPAAAPRQRSASLDAPAVMKRRSKPLPKFKSEAEEAAFWDTHSSADYLDQLKIVRDVRFRRPPRQTRRDDFLRK